MGDQQTLSRREAARGPGPQLRARGLEVDSDVGARFARVRRARQLTAKR
jgi:hypothetical protein